MPFVVMTMSFDTKNARDKNCANSFCSSSLFNQLFVENEGKRGISVSNSVHCVRVKRPFSRKNFSFLPAKQTSGGLLLYTFFEQFCLCSILISRCALTWRKFAVSTSHFPTSFDLMKGSKINATNNRSF